MSQQPTDAAMRAAYKITKAYELAGITQEAPASTVVTVARAIDDATGLPEADVIMEQYARLGPISATIGHAEMHDRLESVLRIMREGRS